MKAAWALLLVESKIDFGYLIGRIIPFFPASFQFTQELRNLVPSTCYYKAYEERSHSLVFLNVDPEFDNHCTDPRFIRLLQKVGLEGMIGKTKFRYSTKDAKDSKAVQPQIRRSS